MDCRRIEFSLSREVYFKNFPNAFTLANPRPMFDFNGQPYVLLSAEVDAGDGPVKCVAREELATNYAWDTAA